MIKLQKFFWRIGPTKIWGFLAILQVVILIILLLTWSPVTLSLVIPKSETAYWSSVIEDFEAENGDIRIRLIGIESSGGITEKLKDICTIDFQTGNSLCDLIYTDVVWMPEFAAENWLMDLSNRVSQEDLDAFIERDVEASRYNAKLYRIPLRSEVGLLYYRDDLLTQENLQPPTTFQELINTSKTLQQETPIEWGYLWQGQSYEGLSAVFVEVLEGFGGFWINEETGEVGLDQPEAVKATNFLLRTLEENVSPRNVLTYTEDEALAAFREGNTAFLRAWSDGWVRSNAEGSPIQGKVGVAPLQLNRGNQEGGGTNGSWGLGIERNSEHPEKAWKVIQYLTSAEGQRKFILETGFLPSRKELYNDPEIVAKYPHFPKVLPAVQSSVLRPYIPEYAEASQILQRYLTLALRKQMTPEAAMSAAAEETRELISD